MRFADDINALAEEEQDVEALAGNLDITCTRYKMVISAKKTELMTNSANGSKRGIKVKRQKLGTVTSCKYLGVTVSEMKTRGFLKDCTSLYCSYSAEAI